MSEKNYLNKAVDETLVLSDMKSREANATMNDIKSEEITEIIGKMPHWIIRRGIIIIAFLCIGILTGSYFFKYPDTISLKVAISSMPVSERIIAQKKAPIQSIFVAENQIVSKDQTLCMFSNATNYNDVMQMINIVRVLDTCLSLRRSVLKVTIPSNYHLGELQSSYVELYQSIQNYIFFLKHNQYDLITMDVDSQISYSNQVQGKQNSIYDLRQQQLEIQQHIVGLDSLLVNSNLSLKDQKSIDLIRQIKTEAIKMIAIQNQLQKKEYAKNIDEIVLNKQKDEMNLLREIKEANEQFKNQYTKWEQNYIVKSPADGKVSLLFDVSKKKHFIENGEDIMIIVPSQQNIIVNGNVTSNYFGKIKNGQKAQLKLQRYPYEEYGLLEAIVNKQPLTTIDSNYVIGFKLKQGLVTNSGKTIQLNTTLIGDAEIITDNRSILSRLFEKVISTIKQ